MKSIIGISISADAGIWFFAELFQTFFGCEQEVGCTFPEIESTAVVIKGFAQFPVQDHKSIKSIKGESCECICSAHKGIIEQPRPDHPRTGKNCVGRRGAGRTDCTHEIPDAQEICSQFCNSTTFMT